MAHFPDGLSAGDYDALPEERRRRIEVVDGGVVTRLDPPRFHQRATRRLANHLDGARYAVDTDVELRLRDVPLLSRRPDIAVYEAALPVDSVLRPEHCLLVVEVMSPQSISMDQIAKPAEYAAAGIEHFWRLELLDSSPVLYRYRLGPGDRAYVLVGKDTGLVTVTDPLSLRIDLDDLY
ncbi:Uma2 family endonuclease [Actinophytocola sp. S1-96]|uniref:Uma2 family endonuclease n=1 Tax=Actinophytocola gossypii TaxID=2812003 RepID=A0ABT2JC42_9PSEU|nr:Uma2 family endonuclease [Actinophytocola gossypii]